MTLVELLVVISILALLIAILVPSLKGAREAGKRTVCATRVGELMNTTHLYITDWDRYPPSLSNTELPWVGWSRIDWLGAGHNGADAYSAPESGLYFSILRQPEVYLCPKDKAQVVTAGGLTSARRFSYSMNGRTGLMIPDRRRGSNAGAGVSKASESTLPVFFEEDLNQNLNTQPEGCFSGDDRPFMRHREKSNVGFADGHVAAEKFKEEMTAKSHNDALGVPIADILLRNQKP